MENENTNTSENEVVSQEVASQEAAYLKILKNKKVLILFGAVLVIGLGLFYTKGLFVAAIVDGSPISRLSVIRELEKQSGKQALESLISKKLIETELNNKGIDVTKEELDEEIKKIEAQVASQGGTLSDALAMQGMTEEQLREQVTIQKKLEKVLADRIQVSDEEITKYIKDNKVATPKGVKIEDFKQQLNEQLKQQKFQQEAQGWISELTTNSKIKYYVEY